MHTHCVTIHSSCEAYTNSSVPNPACDHSDQHHERNPQHPVYDNECEHTESAEEESPTYDPIEEPMCTRYGSDIIGNTTPTHTPQAPVLPVYDHQMEPNESYSDGDLEHDPPTNTYSEMSHEQRNTRLI